MSDRKSIQRWLSVSCLFLGTFASAYVPGKFYFQGHTKEKVIGLTFDDGPGHYTQEILTLLAKHHIHATFFMEGDQVEEYPQTAMDVYQAGNEIGNHTYTHFDFHQKKNSTPERLLHELEQTEATLKRALKDPNFKTKVVRMPYGYFNHTWLLPTLKSQGYGLVHWTFGEDWLKQKPNPVKGQPPIALSPDVLAADYIKNAHPGAVFLFHDGGRHRERTMAAVTTVIETLEAKGYRFIPAREMFPDSGTVMMPADSSSTPTAVDASSSTQP